MATGSGLTGYDQLLDMLDNLGLLVREKRRREGLSVRQAAVAAGVSQAGISRAENGRGMQLYTARALIEWLGRS